MTTAPWTPESLKRINVFIESALDPENEHWEDDARNGFLLMRKHDLGIAALAVTKNGTPADPAKNHGGPHPARRGADPEPLDPNVETVPFGKYLGDTFAAVLRHDPDYIRWVAENFEFRDEALAEMVRKLNINA